MNIKYHVWQQRRLVFYNSRCMISTTCAEVFKTALVRRAVKATVPASVMLWFSQSLDWYRQVQYCRNSCRHHVLAMKIQRWSILTWLHWLTCQTTPAQFITCSVMWSRTIRRLQQFACVWCQKYYTRTIRSQAESADQHKPRKHRLSASKLISMMV